MQVNTEMMKNKMLKTENFMALLAVMMLMFTGFVCAGDKDDDNSPLPDKRPADIKFYYHVDGGMMYYGEELFISADSCYYTVNSGGAESRTDFKLSSDQLDKLYKVFTQNDFDRIKTYTEKVYDRGGESISLRWGGSSCGVSSSGITFINDSWQSEWSACVKAVTDIIENETKKYSREYEIRFDQSLYGKEITLNLNNDNVISKSVVMSENEIDTVVTKKIKVAKGSYMLALSFDKKYEMVKVNTDSTKAVLFYLKQDTIKHRFIK